MKRLLFAFVVAVAAMWALPSVAFAQTNCPTNDGKYEVSEGDWEGDPAPGITIVSATAAAITFTVAEGTTLDSICVKTGNGVNQGDWTSSCTYPVDGPATCTVTSSGGQGAGLSHITFAVSTKPPGPQPPGPQPPGPQPPGPQPPGPQPPGGGAGGGGAGGTPPSPLAPPAPSAAAGGGGGLPFTGLPVWIPLLAGAGLLGSGLVLLRRRRDVES